MCQTPAYDVRGVQGLAMGLAATIGIIPCYYRVHPVVLGVIAAVAVLSSLRGCGMQCRVKFHPDRSCPALVVGILRAPGRDGDHYSRVRENLWILMILRTS